jgi:hypothetical protein
MISRACGNCSSSKKPDTGYAYRTGGILVKELLEEQTAIAVEETLVATPQPAAS